MTFYFQCAYINYLVSVGCFFCKFFLESRISHLKIKIQSNKYVYIYMSHRITNYKIAPHEGVQWRNKAFLNVSNPSCKLITIIFLKSNHEEIFIKVILYFSFFYTYFHMRIIEIKFSLNYNSLGNSKYTLLAAFNRCIKNVSDI